MQLEARAADIQAASDARLAAMAPSMRQQHAELTAEQASLTAEAARFEEAASELDSALAAAEGELARNTLKQRAVEFQVSRWLRCTHGCTCCEHDAMCICSVITSHSIDVGH